MICLEYLGILTVSVPPAVSYIYTVSNYRKTFLHLLFHHLRSLSNHTRKLPTPFLCLCFVYLQSFPNHFIPEDS